LDGNELAHPEGLRSEAGRGREAVSEPRRLQFLIYELRRRVLVAMAAAAVRFSTPSLA
jgi:hypothetical protein